jgi:carbonic anhydrase/acetyltransferase-like protein (isoleucine patch superfamily)
MIYSLNRLCPIIAADCFIAADSNIIGNVTVEEKSSIWFGVTIRGDNDSIVIRKGTNIQDGTVVHTDPGFKVEIGPSSTIGHRVVLHGCKIGSYSLIGINSVILNGAHIGPYCLIGANSMVTAGKIIPERSLVMGSPGKIIRTLTDAECETLEESAMTYQTKINLYRDYFKVQG